MDVKEKAVSERERERERERKRKRERVMTEEGASRLTTVPIDHSHSQHPVPRGFLLFKRCEWLVVNRDVVKWTLPKGRTSIKKII